MNLEPVELYKGVRVWGSLPPLVAHPGAMWLTDSARECGMGGGGAVTANSRCWSILGGAGSRLGTDVWQREGTWQSGAQGKHGGASGQRERKTD